MVKVNHILLTWKTEVFETKNQVLIMKYTDLISVDIICDKLTDKILKVSESFREKYA